MKKVDKSRPLWAPWRIKFIRSKKSSECFLCNNEVPHKRVEESLIIARGKNVFAILNRYPYNSGHLLIAPYQHTGDITQLPKETLYELNDFLVIAKKVMDKVFNPDGYNVGFNFGKAAGAGVEEHLHMHVVPRWNGDTNFMPVLADVHCVPEALEETAKLLKENWKIIDNG